MTATTLSRNGHSTVTASEMREQRVSRLPEELPPPAPETLADDGSAYHVRLPSSNGVNGHAPGEAGKHILAMFCFEQPSSPLGNHVRQLAAALARRHTTVHLFSPHTFEMDSPAVHVHALPTPETAGLLERVQTFNSEACNAFLQLFPGAADNVTLMGFDWSGAGPLSMLHGLKNLRTLFSLHSLERQRSDMSQELSQRIEEIELTALRESSTILVQEPATGEVAKFWVPECARRLEPSRQMFPVHRFERKLDAGAVKARYQVGPVDPTILYLGDHSERYGPDLLLKAMPAILKNNKQVRLVVAGCGDMYWPLRVYARYLLLEHAVRLPGSVEGDAADELIQAADVIAVPSREATPWWPILAGWAAGKPVVATHSAAPQLLEHERDSVLCYPSENSVVWGIERVLFDPELGRKLAIGGREKLEERFGWNTLAEQVEELMGVPASR